MSILYVCQSVRKIVTTRTEAKCEKMTLLFQNSDFADYAFIRPAVASNW